MNLAGSKVGALNMISKKTVIILERFYMVCWKSWDHFSYLASGLFCHNKATLWCVLTVVHNQIGIKCVRCSHGYYTPNNICISGNSWTWTHGKWLLYSNRLHLWCKTGNLHFRTFLWRKPESHSRVQWFSWITAILKSGLDWACCCVVLFDTYYKLVISPLNFYCSRYLV